MTLQERTSPKAPTSTTAEGLAAALDTGHRVLAIDRDRSDVLPLLKDHRASPLRRAASGGDSQNPRVITPPSRCARRSNGSSFSTASFRGPCGSGWVP